MNATRRNATTPEATSIAVGAPRRWARTPAAKLPTGIIPKENIEIEVTLPRNSSGTILCTSALEVEKNTIMPTLDAISIGNAM